MLRVNQTPPNSSPRAVAVTRPAAPVSAAVWRVRAVIPCYNRSADLALLLQDLLGQIPRGTAAPEQAAAERARLSILIVDNASPSPLEAQINPPQDLDVEFLRLANNQGGAGGFNAGMKHWLAKGIPGDACELLWLLDSDVRLAPGALARLLEALEKHPHLGAVGSALVDPVSSRVFELGGRVDRRTGEYLQELPKGWEARDVVPAEYLAACSMLVRRTAAERAGLMADLFLNGDDVEWSYRLARLTGMQIGVATRSRAIHPRPDKMRTVGRYYAARNAATAIHEASRPRPEHPAWDPRPARFARALRETGRALSQALVGRADLGELHLRGLRDALEGVCGPAPEGALEHEPFRPLDQLPEALKTTLGDGLRGKILVRPGVLPEPAPVMRMLNSLCYEPVVKGPDSGSTLSLALAALRRIITGPPHGLAIVSARGYPPDWAIARTIITIADGGFAIRRLGRLQLALTLSSMAFRGLRLARDLRSHQALPAGIPAPLRLPPRPSISVVVLSYNRWEKLQITLTSLRANPVFRNAQIIVADNGSSDATPQRLPTEFPNVQLLQLGANRGIAAFNAAARHATGEVLLILDDDAWPNEGAMEKALDVLAARADIAAVPLHPQHARTLQSEWPFGDRLDGPDERWPVMGCGNLVRRDAWERIGGYEEAFFLYRNDTDLALKLLARGYRVYYDPMLIVWHDSPATARKSGRWFQLATRNWVWLCRRHGRGLTRVAGILLGWAWAHKLAGARPAAHVQALRGGLQGLLHRPPAFTGSDPAGLRRLLGLRFGRGR